MTNRGPDDAQEQPACRAQPDAMRSVTPEPAPSGHDSRCSGEEQHERIRERYYKRGDQRSQSGYGNQSNPVSPDRRDEAAESSKAVAPVGPRLDRWQPELEEAEIERRQQRSPDRQG